MAGGGEGDGVHSFAPPPVPLFSEGPIYRNSCYEAGPDLPKRGGRNRQSDGCTEFIFLNGSGWAQADQLIKDHTPPKHTSTPAAQPRKRTKVFGLAETKLPAPKFIDESHRLGKMGAPNVRGPWDHH